MWAFRQSFNRGAPLTDHIYWNQETQRCLHHYLDWEASCDHGRLNRGDETRLHGMFKDDRQLDRGWHRCGYGNLRPIAWLLKKPLGQTQIIHWSGGDHKPWKTQQITDGHRAEDRGHCPWQVRGPRQGP